MDTVLLSNALFRRVGTGFLLNVRLFRANFVLVQTIQIKVKSFLQSNLSPTIESQFLGVFLDVPAGESSFSS